MTGTAIQKTLLLVDDASENLYTIGSLLQPHYRVRVANGGAVALEVARRQPPPDLILLDIMMPEIDGYEVLRQLKASPATSDIPVIFVTAMDTHSDEEHGLALGAVDYLTKPVVPALLLARVRTQLELKEARDWLKDRNAVLATEVANQVVALKAAKEAAEAASQSKSDFIDSMSYELHTPMNGVIGMLQLAQMEIPAGHPALEYIKIAYDSSQAMVSKLDAVLEYTNIAHGKVSLHESPLDIADLLQHLTLNWRKPIEQKGLRFDVIQHPGLPETIHSDETRLKHVLGILLDNALKFTASGHIELGAEPLSSGLHLWVRDTGFGIPADKHPCIFRPFEQADCSNTRPFRGTGLGLAIAQRLVELMAGKIRVDSAPGTGSTFHITLPA